ncbi:hypothetical protein [Bacillus thuringiensis]|uniref:Uncharacterized protein n=1 Tax=Bacillus thuringiensis TaxID=1428 RepID=A0A9X6VCR6_BACTU|nr:hypothetical protein [Bacillus thuringiensis]MEC3269941.1 hypothetical protein [Bacillus thuringiensis]PFB07993.1 hypothetical protein CN398_09710 [Bacillus thuringiensis]
MEEFLFQEGQSVSVFCINQGVQRTIDTIIKIKDGLITLQLSDLEFDLNGNWIGSRTNHVHFFITPEINEKNTTIHRNYKEFKNLIHNDLKMDKEEIRELIRETIAVETKVIMEGKEDYINTCIESYIQHLIKQGMSDNGKLVFGFKERVATMVSNQVGHFIANQLEFDIKVKERNEKNG